MDWIRTHPYPTATALTVLLILGGVIIVEQHSSVAPQDSLTAWNGGTLGNIPTLDTSGSYVPQAAPPTPHISPTDNGGNYKYISPFDTNKTAATKTPAPTTGQNSNNDGFTDFATFAASLSRAAAADSKANADAQHVALADVYAYIPTGMYDVSTEGTVKRTPTQDALYQYGNDVGNIIKSFEDMHQNQVGVLKDFAEDRTNPDKQAAMKKLGSDYQNLAQTLDSIEPPTQEKTFHKALMTSYTTLGSKLAAIPDAARDEDVVTAMETYDASADAFVKSFVNVALVFPTYQVQFSNDEGGSVFMLPTSGAAASL